MQSLIEQEIEIVRPASPVVKQENEFMPPNPPIHEDHVPHLTTLIIDGGHFDFALESATRNYARKKSVDATLFHFDIDLFLENLEHRLNIELDYNQLFYYQGTHSGEPNAFHMALREQYGFKVRVYDMKDQSGRESISYADRQKASKTSVAKDVILKEVVIKRPSFLSRMFGCCAKPVPETPVVLVDEPKRIGNILKIRTERAVDVQIGVKMVECSLGKNGAINNPNMLVISGDGDLEPACVSVSDMTNLMVISQHGSMARSIKMYLPTISFNIEKAMEWCMVKNA